MMEIVRTGGVDPIRFAVTIRDGENVTRHEVSLSRDLYARLSNEQYSPEQCIDAAFRFLLDREAKESILARFDVAVIGRYFPEFERDLPRYLTQ